MYELYFWFSPFYIFSFCFSDYYSSLATSRSFCLGICRITFTDLHSSLGLGQWRDLSPGLKIRNIFNKSKKKNLLWPFIYFLKILQKTKRTRRTILFSKFYRYRVIYYSSQHNNKKKTATRNKRTRYPARKGVTMANQKDNGKDQLTKQASDETQATL